MSRWTTLAKSDLYAAKAPDIIDAAVSIVTDRGEPDPTPDALFAAVSRVRAAISTGNKLDANTSKIPNSLKDLAVRIAIRRIKGIAEMELTPGETKDQDDDRSYLKQISEQKIRFEQPDTDGGNDQQPGSSFEVASNIQERQFTSTRMRGL